MLSDHSIRSHAFPLALTGVAPIEQLLGLMTLAIRGQAYGRVWADRIRERVHLAGGHARHVRPHDDPKHHVALHLNAASQSGLE